MRAADTEGAPGIADRSPPPSTVELVELPIAITDYERTLDWIDEAIAGQAREYVCVTPVHLLMAAYEDPEVRIAVGKAGLIVPDGQPLVWALHALGASAASRVYGPDLMIAACQRAVKSGARMYLYGGRNDGALVQLTLNLRRRFPGLNIVGGYSPPYRPLELYEEESVAAEINASGADIVWVGTGQPKQELWMANMRSRLDAQVLIGVGAAFDFHAGLVPQAPRHLQEAGLEWAWRLVREPRRLWRRYLRYNPWFVFLFARQWLEQRRGRVDR